MASSDDVSIRVGADTSGLDSALRAAKSGVESFASASSGSLTSLTSAFTGMTTSVAGIGVAVGVATAAIGAVGAAVEKFGGRATEIKTMSDTIGLSTSQFQVLEVAADATGVSMDKVARGVEKLNILLIDARDKSGAAIAKLHALGITNDQIADSQFIVNNMLGVFHDRLLDANTAEATSNALKKEFGVRTAAVVEVLKAYDGSAASVAKVMKEIGGLEEKENDRLVKAYGAWKLIGTEIKNASAALLLWMIAVGKALDQPLIPLTPPPSPAHGTIDRSAVAAQDAIQVAAEKSAAAQIAASNNITEATLKDIERQIAETAHGTAERLALIKQFFVASLEFYGGDDVAEVRKAGAEMVSAEREFQAKRLKEAEAVELEITERETKHFKALSALHSEQIKLELDSDNKYLDSQKKVAEDEAQAFLDAKLGEIAASQKALSEELKDGEISSAAFLTQDKALIDQREALWRGFYAVKKGYAAASGDVVGEAAAQRDLTKQIATEQKNRQVAENEALQASLARWRQFSSAIESSFSNAIIGMVDGTMTLATAMRSILSSAFDAIIQMMVRVMAKWIEDSIFKKELAVQDANTQIAAGAAVGAVNAGASVAAIPVWGWAAAAGVMAAMFALASSYHAEGGFDIPAGISPLTQLHPREMVLPAEHADTIRSLRGGKGGGGSTTFNVSALDSKSVQQLLTDHRGFVAQTLRDHLRTRR